MATVLVIDDNAMNQTVARLMLEQAGHKAILASSGEEGLAKLKENGADIVLLDIEMPGMNGYQVMEQLRQDPQLRDTRVAFLTGTVDEEVTEKAAIYGIKDIIEKPFRKEVLLGVV